MASVLSLVDVKEHLQMSPDPTPDDREMLRFLEAAESRLSHEVGVLAPATFTETHARHGGGVIYLRRRPVQSVSTVNGAAPLASDVDLDDGVIYTRGYGRVPLTVVYVAGYSALPSDLRIGILELFRHLWSTQRGTAGAGGARAQMFGQVGEVPTTAAGMASYTLPNRVLEMIRPYQRSFGFA